jgi:hypothetical protein
MRVVVEVVRRSGKWRVSYNGTLTAPSFLSHTGALAYAESVRNGKAPPDFGSGRLPLAAERRS